MIPAIPTKPAAAAAVSIGQYCETRFQDDVSEVLDLPWFAEKVQLAIDEATADLEKQAESFAAELNRRRSTDSVVRQTLQECGAPDDHSLCDQIEWLSQRSVRRLRLLERVASHLRGHATTHNNACICEGCRLILEIEAERQCSALSP